MSTENKDKPNVIEDYNEYKHAVDTFVQLVKEYTTKRGVRRWVMSLFFSLLDMVIYNAYVLTVHRDARQAGVSVREQYCMSGKGRNFYLS